MMFYQKESFSMKSITQTSTANNNGQSELGEKSKLLDCRENKSFWSDVAQQGQIRKNYIMANFHFYQKWKVLIFSKVSLCIMFLNYHSEIIKKPQ